MAKRAPILPEGYNPVGEALKKAITQQVPLAGEPEQKNADAPELVIVERRKDAEETPKQYSSSLSAEEEETSEVYAGRELKQTSFRFRCTDNERRKWHLMSQDLTGEHSQLSHFARAAFMLFDHAFEELQKRSPEIRRMRYPAKSDHLGQALYEQRLAVYLFEAIKAAGRPRS